MHLDPILNAMVYFSRRDAASAKKVEEAKRTASREVNYYY